MLQLNHILEDGGIDPKECLVMRHRPTEMNAQRVFSNMCRQHPHLLDAYQRTQYSRAEGSMTRAKYLVSCHGENSGEALLMGIFKIDGYEEVTNKSQFKLPEVQKLISFGINYRYDLEGTVLRFKLERLTQFVDYEFRLAINWPGLERSWFRLAHKNQFNILSYLPEKQIDPPMPDWDGLALTWRDLSTLPPSWQAKLREWRGIYLVTDLSREKHYVGSAYGETNILGRWQNYAQSGHGGNKLLKASDPNDLQFSLLELCAPNAPVEFVIERESRWKDRLFTRQIGLNGN